MEITTVKSSHKIAKSVFGVLKEAHNFYSEYRVGQFLNTVDTELEDLSIERQSEINEFLERHETKKILSDYAATITNTPSEIVLRALALLFVDDRQFDFSLAEKSRFLTCVNGMDDLKVNLFIKLTTLKKLDFGTVYPIYFVDHKNFEQLNLNVAIDELFAYTEDFINRGLLLRDPRTDFGGNFHIPNESDWSICFGVSSTLSRYSVLLNKAKYLAKK